MAVFLRKIRVDGYKNLIDCEAEIRDLNVMVGPNNSGKSNFLEIFTFLDVLLHDSDSQIKNLLETASSPRGDSALSHIHGHTCKPLLFTLNFDRLLENSVAEIEYSIKIKCKDYLSELHEHEDDFIGFLSEELTYKEKNKPGKPVTLLKREKSKLQVRTAKGNFSRHNIPVMSPAFNTIKVLLADTNNYDSDILDSISALSELLSVKIISASPNELRDALGKGGSKPFGIVYKTTAFDLLPVIEDISKDELLFAEFKNVVCSILDVENVSYTSFKFPEEYKTKDSPDHIKWCSLKPHGQPFSYIGNFSDGTLMVIALLAALFAPNRSSNIICIEEPENCLHPKALRTLVSFLKAKSSEVQLLITTHSPSLLNQIDPNDLIVARVHEDGGTRLERIGNLKELNRTLRRGYISFGDLLESEFKEEKEEIF